MDAHSQDTAGADGAREDFSVEDAAAALSNMNSKADDLPEEEDEIDDVEAEDDQSGDDGGDDEGDEEPETPAIQAPASLTAEEKATFEQLPPEAQRVWAESETRRNRQVQEVTTRAAETQRTAAVNATAQAQAVFAQQLLAVANYYAPEPPDPSLAMTDPGTYIAYEAHWKQAQAQHEQIVQQALNLSQQVQQHESIQNQQWQFQQLQALNNIPEFADPVKRSQFLTELESVGAAMGYTPEVMRDAGAADILALKTAAEWKAGYDKWNAAQSGKMQRVRDARSAKPGAGQPVKAGKQRALSESRDRLRQTGSLNDAARLLASMRK